MRTSLPRFADARGSASLELVVVAPALLVLIGLVVVGGRVAAAGSAVEQAAAAGARSASLARDARTAQADARRSILASLESQSVACEPLRHAVDVSEFAVALGRPAEVSVRVSCAVPVGELAVPGLPGHRMVSASVTSPIDSFRARE